MSIKGINSDPYRAQFERANAARASDSGPRTGQTTPAGDRVSVSQDGLLRTEALRVAIASPDMRQEKIDALRQRLASGEYHVDSRSVAEKMLRSEAGFLSSLRPR